MNKPVYTFFLPQFHECDFNNEWWGKGFTEWNNVRNSKKLFNNHDQPKIPLNGYFDLNNVNELTDQANLAKSHGINGFIFYHYWSKGQRPLGKVLDTFLANKVINIDFALSWANHSWTKTWTNNRGSLNTLFKQEYEIDNTNHFDFIAKCMIDERYISIDGKKLFIIYDYNDIPNLKEFISNLRNYFTNKHKIDIYIVATVTGWSKKIEKLNLFDAIIISQPSNAFHSPSNIFDNKLINIRLKTRLKSMPNFIKWFFYLLDDLKIKKPRFFDFKDVVDNLYEQIKYTNFPLSNKLKLYHSCFIDWDNTPRYKKRATIIKNFDLNVFENQLKKIYNSQEIIFIYAWNEWGEGMYLQPDIKYKYQKLEVIKKVVNLI